MDFCQLCNLTASCNFNNQLLFIAFCSTSMSWIKTNGVIYIPIVFCPLTVNGWFNDRMTESVFWYCCFFRRKSLGLCDYQVTLTDREGENPPYVWQHRSPTSSGPLPKKNDLRIYTGLKNDQVIAYCDNWLEKNITKRLHSVLIWR